MLKARNPRTVAVVFCAQQAKSMLQGWAHRERGDQRTRALFGGIRQWGGWKSFNTMLLYLADVNASDSVKAMDDAENRINAASEKSDKEITKKLA